MPEHSCENVISGSGFINKVNETKTRTDVFKK